jgi:hypothetical protein
VTCSFSGRISSCQFFGLTLFTGSSFALSMRAASLAFPPRAAS